MTRVLITGATGFAGLHVARCLASAGHEVLAGGRSRPMGLPGVRWVHVPDQLPRTDWSQALIDVDVVVHMAGRAHAESNSPRALDMIHQVNVLGTEALARQAAVGVRSFIFISSIKAHGEETGDAPFRPGDALRPEDPYGRSKADAEDRLRALSSKSGMQLVIVRPPLLIGAEPRGNLRSLIKLVASGFPLPFASIRNQRSLLSIDNLGDLIALCVDNTRASDLPLLPADMETPSTPELVSWISRGIGLHPNLVACPPALLEASGLLVGRRAQIRRLTRSLIMDTEETRLLTGWKPLVSSAESVALAARSVR